MLRLAALALCLAVASPTEIRLGFITVLTPFSGSDPLAGFLTAVAVMNSDPERYLSGNFTVVPYWMAPISFADTYKVLKLLLFLSIPIFRCEVVLHG